MSYCHSADQCAILVDLRPAIERHRTDRNEVQRYRHRPQRLHPRRVDLFDAAHPPQFSDRRLYGLDVRALRLDTVRMGTAPVQRQAGAGLGLVVAVLTFLRLGHSKPLFRM